MDNVHPVCIDAAAHHDVISHRVSLYFRWSDLILTFTPTVGRVLCGVTGEKSDRTPSFTIEPNGFK